MFSFKYIRYTLYQLCMQMVASWFQEFNDEQKNILILQLLVGVCNCLYFKSFVTDGCILKLKKII